MREETFRTDADYELTVNDGWDRDGELLVSFETDESSYNMYFSQAEIKRLRNTLSIALGE